MATNALVGRLSVGLSLDKAAFQKGILQAKSGLARFSDSVNKRLGALGNLPGVGALQAGLVSLSAGVGAAAATAAAAATTALSAMSVSAINTAAEIQNLSRLANAAPEEFQRMAYAAERVGISQEKFSDILKDVNDRVGDFIATGGGPMKDFFERIAPQVGVTAEQFRKLSGPQALQLYVDSLEKANVNQQDFTFFMEAMASDSTALLPILRNGGKAAQEYGDRLVALGGVMSNDTVARLAAMKSAMSEVGVVMGGLKNQFGAAFAPVVASLARTFVSLFEAGAPLRALFDVIAGAVSTFADVLSSVITIASAVVSGIWEVVAAGAAWLNEITGLGEAITWLWDHTIGGVIDVLGWFANLIEATGGIGGALHAVSDIAVEVWQRIGDSASYVTNSIRAMCDAMKAAFFYALHDMSARFFSFISGVASAINGVFGTALSTEVGSEMLTALNAAGNDALEASTASARAAREAAARAVAPLASLAEMNSKIAESAQSAAGALGGAGGGTGLAAAADGAGSKAKNAKEKLTDLQKVMKALREEAQKLTATMGMTELQAKIWEKQREAGVEASSANGKTIAALVSQIDAMERLKDATEKGRDALKGFFGSFLEGADSAKQAVLQLLAQIAKVQFAKGAIDLLGQTSWGGGLIKTIGGLLGQNANGTPNWRGGLTRVNERGGEIMNLPRGTKIIPHDISKRMADGGGGGAVDVRVYVDQDGNWERAVERISGNVVASTAPRIVGQSVQASQRSMRKSKAGWGI